ncbi:MAG: NAD(P)H-dependent oxidoreductase [Candidatus Dormiibacterota bacterium]
MKVVGLGGSLAAPSRSLAALRTALAGARESGAETDLLDLRELQLPLYVPTDTSVPPSARRLLDAASTTDAMVWSSPLYQGTVSGAFKNALDWLHLLSDHEPAFLSDQVIGLVATAGGIHGLQAVNTMEFSVRALRAFAVPLVVTVGPAAKAFDAEGNLTDASVRESLENLGREVARIAGRFHEREKLESECAKASERLALAAA